MTKSAKQTFKGLYRTHRMMMSGRIKGYFSNNADLDILLAAKQAYADYRFKPEFTLIDWKKGISK